MCISQNNIYVHELTDKCGSYSAALLCCGVGTQSKIKKRNIGLACGQMCVIIPNKWQTSLLYLPDK